MEKKPVSTNHFWKGALNSKPSKCPETDVIITVTSWSRMKTQKPEISETV